MHIVKVNSKTWLKSTIFLKFILSFFASVLGKFKKQPFLKMKNYENIFYYQEEIYEKQNDWKRGNSKQIRKYPKKLPAELFVCWLNDMINETWCLHVVF